MSRVIFSPCGLGIYKGRFVFVELPVTHITIMWFKLAAYSPAIIVAFCPQRLYILKTKNRRRSW